MDTKRPSYGVVAVVSVIGAALSGCAPMREALPIGPLDVRVVGEMAQVRPTGPVDDSEVLYRSGSEAVRVSAAANETVSFQVVVDAGPVPLTGVRVQVSDLAGTPGRVVEAGRIELFREVPVAAPTSAWAVRLGRDVGAGSVYDMLVPIDAPTGGQPFEVPAGGRLALWVDVPVARETTAGRYAGTLTVTARADGRRVERKLPLQLDVWDLILPDTRPVTALGAFDHRTLFAAFCRRGGEPFRPVWLDRNDPLVRRGLTLMRQMMVLAHRHHVDLFDTAVRPIFKRDQTGAIRLHWEDYDAVVTPYLSGSAFDDRIGVAAWPAPWCEDWPDPSHYGGIGTETYRRTAEGLTSRSVEHFQQIGYADKLLFYPVRTAGDAAAYTRLVAMAELVRRLAPGQPILSRLPLHPPSGTGLAPPDGLDALVDLTAPPAQWLDPARAADGATAGLAGAYLAPGDPPYVPPMGVLASPADVRALGWLAMRAHLRGLFLPDVLGWDVGAPGEGAGLFYPGTSAGLDEVLPSIRLKRLRRGLEDAAWIRLLRRRGGEAAVERIVPMMARYMGLQAAGDDRLDGRLHGWVAEGAPWRLARVLLAAEVAAAGLAEDAANDDTALARRLAQRRLAEAAGTVIVERIATHIEPVNGPRLEGRMTATVQVELFNPTAEAVQVKLRLPTPPPEFTLEIPEASATLTAGGRTTTTLRFACPVRAAGPAGKLAVPVQLEADGQPPRMLQAAVPVLLSPPVATSVTVDGDLAEWPARPGNAAADFRRFGRAPDAAGAARVGTQAWVQHDKDSIYLAFRCGLPDGAAPTAGATNHLRYDQWMPVGEDVVEVVLDPGAEAASAADLYRLTIKANGVLVPTRGLPGGSERFWPVDAQVAVRQADGVMYVEAAIPRAAFGAAGGAWQWRINLVRISTDPPEASDWAEATRHPYHPATLGSLLLLEN